ncbi:MAG: hypothetical protein AOY29_03955 [Alcanivorax borkumensis]|jgi:putative lipoic acid-binding regulatory protein|uniref:Uncharacterized protein n=1 Tax=Alcanivorax borkumensis (strain ATCC 700651 / DSM 11573 / NCIMB 13689 / SK2) TaxID=393595 RepID=Q0VN39_ALCBS|nr:MULTISPECIES: DUF493 domain-containing protein [Alcanivorax]EUC67882.1 hypothetical protein Y017_09325 [Alcanivorax sp. 97CO-5]OJH07049.1 MAG: hypothetical protein AOY29_03955 [Alcanivorax borkumensis]PKG00322.1 DUF493 domain-containing protein [Alcanivorax sp. 97CO-6]CAL17409.1 conserved hypothetical protein [Alcanivorax borkumensis SK2]
MAIQEHLWEFPHDMQLKVMGAIDSPLEAALIEILNTHLEDFDADKHLNSKPSSKGTFISFTAKVTMRNREQVEAIYKALSDSPHVKVTL